MWFTARLLESYRSESEDRAEIISISEKIIVLILADGVGGRENGGPAAARAVELVKQSVRSAPVRQLSEPGFFTSLLQAIDEQLADDPNCGQTTLVVAALTPDRLVGASVGDSEAWWIAATDRSVALTENQQRKPFMGQGMANPVSFAYPMPATGTILLASDGLFGFTSSEQIIETVALGDELDEVAEQLYRHVCGSSGKPYDDFSVLLARAVTE